MEFACMRIAVYFIVMPFNNMGQCGCSQVIRFSQEFLFIVNRYLAEQFFTHIVEPGLCVGEEEEKFEPFGFCEQGVEFRVMNEFLSFSICGGGGFLCLLT